MPHDIFQAILRTGRILATRDDPAAALRRFAGGDADAFAPLVGRYGPMVLGVCRRVLGPTPDADDAFQATFLSLIRHARSIRDAGSLPGWLHRTALNAALKAKARARLSLNAAPEPVSDADPLAEASWREVRRLLDEELNALPEPLRGPLVLCYLEARAHADAARHLGVSVSTLKRRLERGRELLRVRLVRRGIGAAGLAASVLGGTGLAAPVPSGLFRKAVGLAAVHGGAGVSPAVSALATGGKALAGSRLVFAAACVLLAGLAAGGLLVSAAGEPPQPAAPEARPAAEGMPEVPQGDPLPEGALARLGTSWLRGKRCLFLPDGKQLVRERVDGSLQLFAVPSGKPLARIRGTDIPGRKEIIGYTIAFTRDGKHLAAVCWEGRCGIWEAATGKLVRWLESGPFYSIVQCDFSPDGKWLAVGSGDPKGATEGIEVGVYEVESGRRLFTTPGTNSAFAPDGGSLVTWDGYRHGGKVTARRVEVPSGKVLGSFTYREGFPDFTPPSDGVWFFEVTADRAVRVWDVASGDVKHTFRLPEARDGSVIYVRHVSGRREVIVVATDPAGVGCWDLETGKELWQARLTAPAYFPPLSRDGTTLVTGEKSGNVRVWDAATGKERSSFRPGAVGHDTVVAVSPDGKTVATHSGGYHSTAVVLWDAATGKRLSDLPGHASDITAAAFAPDSATAFTAGKDRTLRSWDPATGRERSRTPSEPWQDLAASPDGETLFAAGADGAVRVLDARTGKVERPIPAFAKSVVGLALTADGKRLVTAGRDREEDDGLVRIYDAVTGAKLREFGGSVGRIEQLAIQPDGEAIATTHVGQRVVLWDTGGKKVLELRGRGERVAAWAKGETPYRIGSVGVSPDGRWLAYSDQEQGIAIVNVRTGHEARRAKPDVYFQAPSARDEVRDVLAFSPDGKTVAWSGVESTADVFLIEVRTGLVRRRLAGESFPVRRLVYSPDGSTLLSAGPDGTGLVWDVLGRSTRKPAGAPPLPKEVAGWWDRLADPDAGKAFGAMREMAAHPAEAMALLRERLKPIRKVEAAKLDALITKLGAGAFADREEASRELVALADAAEPRLRAALREATDPEVKRRAEEALGRIDDGRLRFERSVEVLERVGDAAARELLKELAAGMPGAAGTTDAAAAHARTEGRKRRD